MSQLFHDLSAPFSTSTMANSFRNQLYINGKWTDPVDGGNFETINPANGRVITKCANATQVSFRILILFVAFLVNSSLFIVRVVVVVLMTEGRH